MTKVDMATGPGQGQSPVSFQSPPAWGRLVLSQGRPLACSLVSIPAQDGMATAG